MKRLSVCRVPGNKCGWRVNLGGSREQYHIRCESAADPADAGCDDLESCSSLLLSSASTKGYSFAHQTWPANNDLHRAAPHCAEELRKIAETCIFAVLQRHAPSSSTKLSLPCLPNLGPSVLDAFRYSSGGGSQEQQPAGPKSGGPAAVILMEHADPGLVTLEPRATLRGLEVWDTAGACWRCVESLLRPLSESRCDLVVMVGERLEAAAGHGFRSCRHRVRQPPPSQNSPRDAVVFELRCI